MRAGDSQADRKGTLILPCTLLMATTWPRRRWTMEGRSAVGEAENQGFRRGLPLVAAPAPSPPLPERRRPRIRFHGTWGCTVKPSVGRVGTSGPPAAADPAEGSRDRACTWGLSWAAGPPPWGEPPPSPARHRPSPLCRRKGATNEVQGGGRPDLRPGSR